MTKDELQKIAGRALAEAHRVRDEDRLNRDRAGDFGREARAWERLSDAADAIHAILDRRDHYRVDVPPTLNAKATD